MLRTWFWRNAFPNKVKPRGLSLNVLMANWYIWGYFTSWKLKEVKHLYCLLLNKGIIMKFGPISFDRWKAAKLMFGAQLKDTHHRQGWLGGEGFELLIGRSWLQIPAFPNCHCWALAQSPLPLNCSVVSWQKKKSICIKTKWVKCEWLQWRGPVYTTRQLSIN